MPQSLRARAYLLSLTIPVAVSGILSAQVSPAAKGAEMDIDIAGIVTSAELKQEIDEKLARVQNFLRQQNLGGVLLTRVNNYSWMTAGLGDNHIVITSEVGAVSLLILRDGRKFVVASHAEMPRVMAEDLAGQGYDPHEFLWYAERTTPDRRLEIIREIAQGQQIGTDVPLPGMQLIDAEFAPLRYQLTESEIKKYRWLGRNTTKAVNAVCRKLRRGMTEREIEALASDELMRRGIRPTVLLMGADARLSRFFHHTPSDLQLDRFIFVNVCARKWGLVISVGRYVHFGPPSEELTEHIRASAEISARLQAHSRPGVKVADLFEMAKKWYAEQGYADGWKPIHMGGAIGYAEREWVAFPGSPETIHERQAFAWNPFIRGTLSFDTIIVHGDHIENISSTPDWPAMTIPVDGKSYKMPNILVR
jgi:antitoxin VapB